MHKTDTIQTQSILRVADNPGARTAKCIKVLGKQPNKTPATVGDYILVTVRSLTRASRKNKTRSSRHSKAGPKLRSGIVQQKGQILKALVVRTRKPGPARPYGHQLCFPAHNEVVLLTSQDKPVGTRVFGPITRELRVKKPTPIISQSKCML